MFLDGAAWFIDIYGVEMAEECQLVVMFQNRRYKVHRHLRSRDGAAWFRNALFQIIFIESFKHQTKITTK
jgi:hypothetical protein